MRALRRAETSCQPTAKLESRSCPQCSAASLLRICASPPSMHCASRAAPGSNCWRRRTSSRTAGGCWPRNAVSALGRRLVLPLLRLGQIREGRLVVELGDALRGSLESFARSARPSMCGLLPLGYRSVSCCDVESRGGLVPSAAPLVCATLFSQRVAVRRIVPERGLLAAYRKPAFKEQPC